MIDLWGVAANALWIVGLAVLLSTLSLSYYRAQQESQRLRLVLRQRAPQVALAVGMILFSVGLAASDDRWWARLLWGALAVLWVWQGCAALRPASRRVEPPPSAG